MHQHAVIMIYATAWLGYCRELSVFLAYHRNQFFFVINTRALNSLDASEPATSPLIDERVVREERECHAEKSKT